MSVFVPACCEAAAAVDRVRGARCADDVLKCACCAPEPPSELLASIRAVEGAAHCTPTLANDPSHASRPGRGTGGEYDSTPCTCASEALGRLVANLWSIEDASAASPFFGLYVRGIIAIANFLWRSQAAVLLAAKEYAVHAVVHPLWMDRATIDSLFDLIAIPTDDSAPAGIGYARIRAAVDELHAVLAAAVLSVWRPVHRIYYAANALADQSLAREHRPSSDEDEGSISLLRGLDAGVNAWEALATVFARAPAAFGVEISRRLMDACVRILFSPVEGTGFFACSRGTALSLTFNAAAADPHPHTEALVQSGVLHLYRALLQTPNSQLSALHGAITYCPVYDGNDTVADKVAFAAANVALGGPAHAEAVAVAGCIDAIFASPSVSPQTRLMLAEAFFSNDDAKLRFKESAIAVKGLVDLASDPVTSVEHARLAALYLAACGAFHAGTEELHHAHVRAEELSALLRSAVFR